MAPAEFARAALPLLDDVTRFARWLCRRGEDADELVQECYARGASPALRAAVETRLAARLGSHKRRSLTSAAVALAAVMTGVGVWLMQSAPPLLPTLRDELALDHRHYMASAEPAQFASNDPRVVEAQLTRALDRPVSVPDWEAATLVGGRACRINRRLVALILYERAGHRVSLFELPREDASDGCDRAEGFNVCARRQSGGGALAIVSDLPQNDLKRLLTENSAGAPETR